jgi:hypothetical protein
MIKPACSRLRIAVYVIESVFFQTHLFNDMKRNLEDDFKSNKKSKYSSLTVNDTLSSISEPATSTSTINKSTAVPVLSVPISAAAASAQVTQVAGVTVSVQLRPSHP